MSSGVRVAYLCEHPTLLGGERSLLAFLDEARSTVRATFVAPETGRLADRLLQHGIDHLPTRDLRHSSHEQNRIADELAQRKIQIIHGNSLSMREPTLQLADRLGVPSVLHVRDIYQLSARQQRSLRSFSAIVAVSPAVESFLHGQGVSPSKIHVIVNGIASPEEVDSAPLMDWPTDAPLIACIGQWSLRKGQDLFAKAARQVFEKGVMARFLLVGERYSLKEESIAFEESIREMTMPLHAAGVWYETGYRDDARQLLPRFDLVVVPSRQEPLSRVLLESLQAGTPVLATRVGGNPYILAEGDVGLLVEANPSAIADGIEEVLSARDVARRRAEQGRLRVAREFSLPRHAERILDLYLTLLSAHEGG
ncbi:glycosyltransferase family 4 protein [bacterium]|nr:glycosyltransferase family 4 protein [bacterium]